MGLGLYLTHFVELSGVSSWEHTDLSSYPPPVFQSAAHSVWALRPNVDFPAARKMQVLFLEGEASLQDRKKKKVWTFGKLSPRPSPSASSRWKPVVPWENRRLPFTELAPLAPSGHRPSVRDFPLALGLCFVFGPGVSTGPWRRFPGAAEKPVHIWRFSQLREGGKVAVGTTTCSRGKIFTRVVFELAAKEGVGCQMCSCVGCIPGPASCEKQVQCGVWGGQGQGECGPAGGWGRATSTDRTPPPAKVLLPRLCLYLPSPGLHYKEHHEGTFPTLDQGDPDGTLLSLAAQCLVRKTGAAVLLISFRGMRIHCF